MMRPSAKVAKVYIYPKPAGLRKELHDAGWQRTLFLESRAARTVVLWNPWIDKARRLSQFAEDGWQRMLCIETANVWDDCVQLAPGARHSLDLCLWSEAIVSPQ
ncbi:hypothetical protein KRX52_13055 [Pseudomonas sp. MAP12]|uniref:Uncharacterized protein n=1 Tax=Geopseudomonas aromaticivorans TaxID=2849492 RepID=A0ABS6MY20_9GAMM|nr:hypothetical protein [Pseudomonas aromaticivorans]MBV2133709.1 hypothetical protein [Pseudomonas aromaticivorans]